MHTIRMLLAALLIVAMTPAMLMAGSLCTPSVLSEIHIKEETVGYSVDIHYPVLCTLAANRVIRDWVGFRLFDFKKLEPDHDLSDFPHKYEMHMGYGVWPAAAGRLASVKLDVSVYTGGAHANHWPMTWVFDINDGGDITLEELFADISTALPVISAVCRTVLPNALGPGMDAMIFPGTEPTELNFSRFILNEEGVAFFFAPYQVAPFAAGEQVVTIPYAVLLPHLSDRIKAIPGLMPVSEIEQQPFDENVARKP